MAKKKIRRGPYKKKLADELKQRPRSFTANDVENGNWEKMATESGMTTIAWAKMKMGI